MQQTEWTARRSGLVRGARPKPQRIRTASSLRAAARPTDYDRKRDLPRLLALWPWEIEDTSLEAHQRLVAMLRRALRQERQRGIGGHWTYDVVRHARLLTAYRCEVASLEARLASASGNRRSVKLS